MSELTELHHKVDTTMNSIRKGILIPIEKIKEAALKDGYSIEQVESMRYHEIECDIDELFSKQWSGIKVITEVKWNKLVGLMFKKNKDKVEKKQYSLKQRDDLLMNVYLSKRIKEIG